MYSLLRKSPWKGNGQQMKEEEYDQNNGFYIKPSMYLLLK